jgi:hypothetical protein
VPANYAEANAGSIKADEWHTLSTIYLPIGLVMLWGDKNDCDSYLLKVLDHTMALFQVVTIVCRYRTNANRVNEYHNFMKEWVDGLHVLHPHTAKHRWPNIHASFHLHNFLLLFGPVKSWWTFPFERLIGTLQKMNTNNMIGGMLLKSIIDCHLSLLIVGTLESTLLKAHMNAANLHRRLKVPDCPPLLQQLKALVDKAFSSDDRQNWDITDREGVVAH